MKVIHSLGWYFPDSVGGTEVYVDGLVRELRSLGIESIVAAPREGRQEEDYDYQGLPVHRYPVFPERSHDQILGKVPHGGYEVFSRWLKSQKAEIYHQHSWTLGCGLPHLRLAKKLGFSTVTTLHVAGPICLRGTLMLNGKGACDGKIERNRCVACWVQSKNVPPFLARMISKIPDRASLSFLNTFPASKIRTVLSTPVLVEMFKNNLLQLAEYSDRIVAVCRWLYESLLLNGIPRDKLVLCRQGVSKNQSTTSFRKPRFENQSLPLRLGFVGRWDRVKGIHLLVRAVRSLPLDVPIQLSLYGVCPIQKNTPENTYQKEIIKEAGGDFRIRIFPSTDPSEIPQIISGLDLLAVPSLCLETGPLVVYEALAVGTPVLGSNLGGIAELIEHGQNGWLVPQDDLGAWQEAIKFFARDLSRLQGLSQGERTPIRTMKAVAEETAEIYQALG